MSNLSAPWTGSLASMKQFLTERGIDFSQFLEKSEFVAAVKAAAETQPQPQPMASQTSRACDCMQGGTEGQIHTHPTNACGDNSNTDTMDQDHKQAAIISQLAVGPLQCNMVIVGDPITKQAVLVDPGGDAQEIVALIHKLGVTIVQIVITHGHFDHFLAAADIHAHTKAPIHLHADDLPLWRMLPMQCMLLGIKGPSKAFADPAGVLTDGATLDVLDGRVIHTPGHSPGSSCFYFPSLKLLCSGDTLFRGSIGRTDLMGGDAQQIKKSIQDKLYVLPDQTKVIPGHGESTIIGYEKQNNMIIKAKSSL